MCLLQPVTAVEGEKRMTPYTIQESQPLYELLREAAVFTAALALGTLPDEDYAKKLNGRLCEKLRELKDA